MPLQNRSDKEETDQRLERASLQELRVRRTSPVPDARDAYQELRQTILQILSREIGRPHFRDGLVARAFLQAQLDDILRQEKIILNRREKRQLSQDVMAALLTPSRTLSHRMPEGTIASSDCIESFFAEAIVSKGANLLSAAVANRKNMLIAGKSRTGKTALLRALCDRIPADDHVITIDTIEEKATLQIDHPHLVSLQTGDPGMPQQHEISAEKLVLAATRTPHYRLVLDSLQGAETYLWLRALNAGQRGSMATCTALSPLDALARLEVMSRQAGPASAEDIRREIEVAIDLIAFIERVPDGRPHIVSIVEVAGLEKGQFETVSLI